LLRADRSSPVVPRARELAARAGFVACHVGAVPGDLRDCLLLAVADDRVHDLHAALPAELVRLATREPAIDQPLRSLFDLERCERRVCSQGGEDGVLEAIFAHIGTTNRSYVEFGCGDGVQCNTAHLRRQGWHGLLMDGVAAPGAADVVIHAAWVTAENIHALLDAHCVPAEPDLLSIDIDGNDYWVFGAITRRPRVVVVEYNANLGADEALTIPYDPEHRWNGTDFYGASLMALEQLGRSKGYTLVYCTQAGVNAFFVRDDLMGGEPRRSVASVYRPPNYWYRGARQVPDLSRAMVTV
ncbi:MAG TPA: hypothetical protein VK348_15335, partial [Planctomycetota bacterium]|nr:hypothetical protein [Planctomycetota bacterium]